MAGSEDELRIGLKFTASDGPIYNYLRMIPKLHRGYELKKLIVLDGQPDVSTEHKSKDVDSSKKERKGNGKVIDALKF